MTFAQLPQGEIAGSDVLKFKSSINNQEYILYIKLPQSYNDSAKKKYPVIYVLDGQWNFTLATEIRGGLLYDNLIPEIIFVGIAFPENWFANRNRDFTPTHTDFDSASGGAPKFLEVIKNEITKKIDSAYRTDKINNGLLGSSLGGLFVLYTLFSQPTLFNRYIANSPSFFYDDEVIFKMEQTFAKKNHILNAKLFMSEGGYEEENDGVGWLKNFSNQLKGSNYKGLEIESLVIDKTGHGSEGPYAISRGLQFIYGKPDIMIDTLLLDKYAGRYEQGFVFSRTGNSLYVEIMNKKLRLCAANNESFYVKGANGNIEFKKDDKGNVIEVNFKMADGNFSSKKLN